MDTLIRIVLSVQHIVGKCCFEVALLGLDVLGAFVDRLSGRFKAYIGTVLMPLIDRMGDAKDQVREQAQNLILKLMDVAAPPMVRDAAILAIVEVYRHVGEKVRIDLAKRGIPPGRLQTIFTKFDELRNSGNMILSSVGEQENQLPAVNQWWSFLLQECKEKQMMSHEAKVRTISKWPHLTGMATLVS
ncbi:CLIP-associating protein 1-like protein [Willisornis vidua]|uniref:CLIP-associating protein 1-like protein n=1 Tax=Willisornis vidua TaxID=1566151 RepID=A0ABQ9DC92_9PASS|nr:CLIP-associating protein 1-like protein [Willisornis vidua]